MINCSYMRSHLLKILGPKHLIVINFNLKAEKQLPKFAVNEIKCHIVCFLN